MLVQILLPLTARCYFCCHAFCFRLAAVLKHMRLTDFEFEEESYSLVIRTLLQLLRDHSTCFAPSLTAMLQLIENMLSHVNEDYQKAILRVLQTTKQLGKMLDAYELARTTCKGAVEKPEYFELLLKTGLRLVCMPLVARDDPALCAEHLPLALADPILLLNTTFRRDVDFDQLFGDAFMQLESLESSEHCRRDTRLDVLKAMLSSSRHAHILTAILFVLDTFT